jgi:Fe2+ transport system protein B
METIETGIQYVKNGFNSVRKTYIYLDETGQLGPIFIFTMGIVLIAFYYTILSPMMYEFTELHQAMQASGEWAIPASKVRAMIMLQYAWKAIVVIAPILLMLWLIMASLRENSGWSG